MGNNVIKGKRINFAHMQNHIDLKPFKGKNGKPFSME
jgi:hypothetical protein